jgi:polyisoprenoid-binding protein YceI
MRRILLSLLVLVGMTSVSWADLPVYMLVKEKCSLKFIAIQNGAPVEGKFTDFNADIHFDPDLLDKSSISAEVSTDSVTTANEDVEKNVKLPDWLSTEAFPKAIFKTKKISRMPQSDNYYADGVLTLRGKTQPVVLNFSLKTFGKTQVAEGYVTLRRNEFNIGQGEWSRDDVIKNEVRVEFRIVAETK